MLDLRAQYLNIKEEIDLSIKEVLESSNFINGDEVKKFSKNFENYLKVKNVIPCGNGTDALQIALMSLNLEKNDEVILPSFTFVSTVEVVVLLGLKAVFVDVFDDTFTINYKEIEKKINSKTRVIIPVHLFGQSAEMKEILEISKKYNLKIIEDNAQAVGTSYFFTDKKYKKTGTLGDISCYSFFPSKNLACFGDGGAIATNDDNLAKRIRSIANHGSVEKYFYEKIGVNSRLDTLQAGILNVKLKCLDKYNEKCKSIADFYDSKFYKIEDLQIPKRSKNSTHTFHQYTLILKNTNRKDFMEFLKTKNIPSAIYYPLPLHLQKSYSFLNYKIGDLPVSEFLSKNVVSIPIHTELIKEELNYITENILLFFNKN